MAQAIDRQCSWDLRCPAAGSGASAVRFSKKAVYSHLVDLDLIQSHTEDKIRCLIRKLGDPRAAEARSMVDELGKLVDGPSVAALVATHVRMLGRLLRDSDVCVRSGMLSFLRKVAEEGQSVSVAAHVPDIGLCLRDDDVVIRQKAARLCRVIAEGGGAAGIAVHVPHLVACLKLNGEALCWAPLEALCAMAEFGEGKAVASGASGAIMRAVFDEKPAIRTAALQILGAVLRCGSGDLLLGHVGVDKDAKDHVNVLDVFVALAQDPDCGARSAGQHALVRLALPDFCKPCCATESHRQAWLAAFVEQDRDQERDIVLEMLKNKCVSWFQGMFCLLKSRPAVLTRISELFMEHCREKCAKVVRGAEDSATFIADLLELERELRELTVTCFDNDSLFQNARDRGMGQMLNNDPRSAKSLAHFCDCQLRKAALCDKDDDEMQPLFASVDRLLKHMCDKDIFLEMYRYSLARRLLSRSNAISSELEGAVVAKISLECGDYATRKLTAMLSDISLSAQLHEDYRKLPHGGLIRGVKHEVRILRSNVWRARMGSGQAEPCSGLLACACAFEGFYSSRFSARRLTWVYSMGSVDINTSCFERRYLLTVSTYQCLILMLFNGLTSFTFKEVCEMTQIPKDECRQQLQSLALPRQKLLVQEPSGKEIEASTRFVLNDEFASEKVRLVVSAIKKEKKADQVVDVDAHSERKHAMDAMIVRIMKSKGCLDHNSLLEEVFKQCKLFKPQPQQIKMQIEHLIEREFIGRDPKVRNVYTYIS